MKNVYRVLLSFLSVITCIGWKTINLKIENKNDEVAAQSFDCTIICPADVVAYTDGLNACARVVSYPPATATSHDCGTLTYSIASGSVFPVGQTTVTVSSPATGQSCTFKVTVIDNTKPTIECDFFSVTAHTNEDDQGCSTVVSLHEPSVNDNCGIPTITRVPAGNIFPVGGTVVIWTATDATGNTATCAQIVEVQDRTRPKVFNYTGPTSFYLDENCQYPETDFTQYITATDNCGVSSVQQDLDVTGNFLIVQITAKDNVGNTSTYFSKIINLIDTTPPVLTCPFSRTFNSDPDFCGANIIDIGTAKATDACGGNVRIQIDGEKSFYPVGTTTVTYTAFDQAGNSSTCTQTITVLDQKKPEIICPTPVTVSCVADIPPVNIALVTASDNCSEVTVSHVGDVITNQTCANSFTLLRTYMATDAYANTSTCTQTITVNDNVPPQLTDLSVSQQVLAPPNHKMRDITVNYTITDNCAVPTPVTITITSNEPVNGTGDGDTDPDWEVIDAHHIRLRAERSANGDGRVYTITVTANDGCNDAVSASTQVRVSHNIVAPQSGKAFIVNSTVNFSGEFWDIPTNKHTAKWLIDDNASVKGIVTEPTATKNGKVTGSHKFTSPGVYKLQMNTIDQNNITSYANTNGDLEAIVVIYDPNGGNTYGGGYFNSPVGALKSNPTATGKASYGFAMNYFKNSTNPKGETQFEFKVGEFEFNALNFDYLVISNSMAQFKGTGKIIGGQSGVGFTMTVVDGQLDGTGIDKIRMKIYNKNNGSIIYDNQPGASDAALPTQGVGTNSIIVISGSNNSNSTRVGATQKGEMEATVPEVSTSLDVIAYPNPSANNFSISVQANAKEKITMQVLDMYGRIIETRNVSANSIVKFGDRYIAGTYFIRIMQGKERKEIKLIKL